MKIECPICHAHLIHREDREVFKSHRITKSGKVKFLCLRNTGGDEVMCSKNANHPIPDELVTKVIDLVNVG